VKVRAAIAWAPTQPLEVREINLAGPQAGESIRSVIRYR
jgi:Zn-dependent alcohol dehydrogenase